MKKIFVLILTLNLIFSEFVNLDTALNIAENFFFYKNDSRTSSFSIESTSIHTVDDENIFYVINLNPRGFMLISADN